MARPKRPRHVLASGLATLVAGLVLLPIVTLAWLAATGSGADWPHLAANVLPGAARNTLLLLAYVALGTAAIGVFAAWAVTSFEFPGRKVISWALVLPFAVPPYLAAYAFADFFHYSGPVQSTLRLLTGPVPPRDNWFPDIRSVGGTALVMTSVLYPYVYLTTRVVFLMQGRNLADAARTLGAKPGRVFFHVLLPVARPAIVAGVVLVLMETLNDVGAAEYLGTRTLTIAVYATWLNRGSLEGAAQIATLMVVLVFALILAERWARRRQRFHAARATQASVRPPRIRLHGWRGPGVSALLLLPILLGFGIPLLVFGRFAWPRLDRLASPELLSAFATTAMIAAATALITIGTALILLNAARLGRSRRMSALVASASLGYAFPGIILGLGLLWALARFDNQVDALARAWFGVSTGLLLTGSVAGIVIACSVRFLALAEGSVRSGIEKLPPNLDEAARSLGRTPTQSAAAVLMPLLRPALLSAFVLVFVDAAKELSATILLRPFGFSTLATLVYENAARGVVEDGALAALLIIATALVPVMLLSRALSRDRAA
ncbi:MAG: iron ABC transporter permease [Methylobacterium mesophilicum]|nr:iron ABC transporter permease [Methylobacterium mesophilicum]